MSSTPANRGLPPRPPTLKVSINSASASTAPNQSAPNETTRGGSSASLPPTPNFSAASTSNRALPNIPKPKTSSSTHATAVRAQSAVRTPGERPEGLPLGPSAFFQSSHSTPASPATSIRTLDLSKSIDRRNSAAAAYPPAFAAEDALGNAVPETTRPRSASASSISASDANDPAHNPSLYKTELCRSFVESGYCRYGLKCRFAHGDTDLRPVVRHKKYKTEKCRNFEKNGYCPYGHRCRFIHNDGDDSVIDDTMSVASHSTSLMTSHLSQHQHPASSSPLLTNMKAAPPSSPLLSALPNAPQVSIAEQLSVTLAGGQPSSPHTQADRLSMSFADRGGFNANDRNSMADRLSMSLADRMSTGSGMAQPLLGPNGGVLPPGGIGMLGTGMGIGMGMGQSTPIFHGTPLSTMSHNGALPTPLDIGLGGSFPSPSRMSGSMHAGPGMGMGVSIGGMGTGFASNHSSPYIYGGDIGGDMAADMQSLSLGPRRSESGGLSRGLGGMQGAMSMGVGMSMSGIALHRSHSSNNNGNGTSLNVHNQGYGNGNGVEGGVYPFASSPTSPTQDNNNSNNNSNGNGTGNNGNGGNANGNNGNSNTNTNGNGNANNGTATSLDPPSTSRTPSLSNISMSSAHMSTSHHPSMHPHAYPGSNNANAQASGMNMGMGMGMGGPMNMNMGNNGMGPSRMPVLPSSPLPMASGRPPLPFPRPPPSPSLTQHSLHHGHTHAQTHNGGYPHMSPAHGPQGPGMPMGMHNSGQPLFPGFANEQMFASHPYSHPHSPALSSSSFVPSPSLNRVMARPPSASGRSSFSQMSNGKPGPYDPREFADMSGGPMFGMGMSMGGMGMGGIGMGGMSMGMGMGITSMSAPASQCSSRRESPLLCPTMPVVHDNGGYAFNLNGDNGSNYNDNQFGNDSSLFNTSGVDTAPVLGTELFRAGSESIPSKTEASLQQMQLFRKNNTHTLTASDERHSSAQGTGKGIVDEEGENGYNIPNNASLASSLATTLGSSQHTNLHTPTASGTFPNSGKTTNSETDIPNSLSIPPILNVRSNTSLHSGNSPILKALADSFVPDITQTQ